MGTKAAYYAEYRAMRMVQNYGLTSALEIPTTEAVARAAIYATFYRREHRNGLQCCRTAPDFTICLQANLRAAQFRRLTGWAQTKARRLERA